MCEEKSRIAEQLALSFHEQFAQNQNHHQRMFVQVLAVLITVLIGFGYAYTGNGPSDEGNAANTALGMLYASLMLSMALLSLAVALIVNMAYGFRRDQTTACRIRMNTGAMNAWESSDDKGIFFPLEYNPVGKTGCSWMPGYHSIFYITLLAIKVILVIIVIDKVFYGTEICDKHGFLYCASIITVVISICLDIFVWCWYKGKWKAVSDNAPIRLQLKSKIGAQA